MSLDDPRPPLARRSLVGLALLALFWGLGLGSREVLAFGAALGGVLVASFLFPRLAATTLRVRRSMPERASEDDDVPVGFTLENRGALPLAWVVVEDVFPPDRVPRRTVLATRLLGPGHACDARYAGNCFGKRGLYAIGPARVHLHDPLGLFPTVVATGPRVSLLVLPTVVPLPALPAAGSGVPLPSGRITARLAGASPLPLGVREYRPGDALRHIHWPTTARRGRLTIVEHESEAGGEVVIVVDLSRAALRGLGRRSTLETSVRIAASAAAHHVRRGDRVGLAGRGKEPLAVPSGTGEVHLARLLEALAHARPDGDVPQDEVLRELAPTLAPGSTALVVVSNLQLGPDRVVAALAHLRARGVSVVAPLLDDASFLKLFDEQARRREETVRLGVAADALLAEGAHVFTFAQADDLAARFAHPYSGPTRLRITLSDIAEVVA